jgi:hypothetical protein
VSKSRAKEAFVEDNGQRLLDIGEIRERLALYTRLRLRETQLQEEEAELGRQLREVRRKLKETRWDLRNATHAVDKTARSVLAEKEGEK